VETNCVTNRSGNKGAEGEREVERIFHAAGYPDARRALGEGRKDDVGDVGGLPRLCLQVFRRGTGLTNALYTKLPATERQRLNRKAPFAAMFARLDRRPWLVVMSPDHFLKLYHYALIGYDEERRKRKARLAADGSRKPSARLGAGSSEI
jgi:hypothetical protein